jgi:hypothetical protein
MRKSHEQLRFETESQIARAYWNARILGAPHEKCGQYVTLNATQAKLLSLKRNEHGNVDLSADDARYVAEHFEPERPTFGAAELNGIRVPGKLRWIAEHANEYVVTAYYSGRRELYDSRRDIFAGSALCVVTRNEWERTQAAEAEAKRAERVYSNRVYALTKHAGVVESVAKASRYAGSFPHALGDDASQPKTSAEVGAEWAKQFEAEHAKAQERLRALQATIEAQGHVYRAVAEAGGWEALAGKVLADVLEDEANPKTEEEKAS